MLTVIKSSVGRILAGKPSRHAAELCNVQVFARVYVFVCVWESKSKRERERKTSSINVKKKKEKKICMNMKKCDLY